MLDRYHLWKFLPIELVSDSPDSLDGDTWHVLTIDSADEPPSPPKKGLSLWRSQKEKLCVPIGPECYKGRRAQITTVAKHKGGLRLYHETRDRVHFTDRKHRHNTMDATYTVLGFLLETDVDLRRIKIRATGHKDFTWITTTISSHPTR